MTREEEERARRDAQHDLESWARKQPLPGPGETPPDPVTVVRIRLPEHDGADLYALCRWSLAARLIRDAADAGDRGQIADLGPRALDIANSVGPDDLAPGKLLHVGLAKDGKWVQWHVPAPAEPVPGTKEWRARRS
jgi:hypothetical protein